MKFFNSLLLLVFMNIHRIGGNGIRIPLSIHDGTVYKDRPEFYGTISIGTPPQKINVLFTTVIGSTRVLSSYCNDSVCRDQNHNTYNHTTSKTFQCENGINFDKEIWKLNSYVPVRDTITIGNMQMQNVRFFVTARSDGIDNKPYDGVLGLGYNILEHCEKFGLQNKFSFYTNYPWDNHNSEFMLCGEDRTRFRGNLQYFDYVDHGYGTWTIKVQSVSLLFNDENDRTIEFPGESLELDPSSAYITGPLEDIKNIYKAINVSTSKLINGPKEVDCKTVHTLPSITFETADKNFTLTGNDYINEFTHNDQRVCTVRLLAHPRKKSWIVGNVFNRKFYTVFEQKKWMYYRIGLAESFHKPAQIMIFLF